MKEAEQLSNLMLREEGRPEEELSSSILNDDERRRGQEGKEQCWPPPPPPSPSPSTDEEGDDFGDEGDLIRNALGIFTPPGAGAEAPLEYLLLSLSLEQKLLMCLVAFSGFIFV